MSLDQVAGLPGLPDLPVVSTGGPPRLFVTSFERCGLWRRRCLLMAGAISPTHLPLATARALLLVAALRRFYKSLLAARRRAPRGCSAPSIAADRKTAREAKEVHSKSPRPTPLPLPHVRALWRNAGECPPRAHPCTHPHTPPPLALSASFSSRDRPLRPSTCLSCLVVVSSESELAV